MINRVRKAGTVAAGVVAAGFGLAALTGWATGDMGWVRLQAAWVPMQVGTGLSLLAFGIAMVLLSAGRGRAAAAFGLLGGLLGILPFPSTLPEPFRAEPISAAGAALAGAALLSAGMRNRRGPVAAVVGVLLAAFGMTAIFCLLRGLTTAFGWEGLMRVPGGSAAGFAAVGLGLLAWPGDKESFEGQPASWRLPLAGGLAAATAAVCLWLALDADQDARIRWIVGGAAEEIKERLVSARDQGALAAALREGRLFGAILPGEAPRSYALEIFLAGRPAYSSPSAHAPGAEPFVRDIEADIGAAAWRIRVWPTPELLAAQASALPLAVLGVGLLLSAILTLTIRLALVAQAQVREIELQRQRAQSASELKSRFLSNISRELGNPLNAILGFCDLLLRGGGEPLSAEQTEDLRAVRAGGWRLAEIAKQLLDLARLEAGTVALAQEALAPAGLIEEVRSTFASEAARKGLVLELEQPAAASLLIRGDRAWLRKALASVVDNALRFTREGKVTLGLGGGDGEVVLTVRDTGPGLSPEEKDNLFEPFWQSRGMGGVKKADGLGLGLHLAKRIIELHGGRMSATGETGAGSVFFVSLPRLREEST